MLKHSVVVASILLSMVGVIGLAALSPTLSSASANPIYPPAGSARQATAFRVDRDSPNLNPWTIAACNAGFGETVVSTYASRTSGNIDLKCGDSASGYIHIRERHENDWRQVVNIAGGGGNWDDLMDFVTKQSVEAPLPGYPRDIGSGKLCFTTPALIVDSAGNVVRTLAPTVIVSNNNKKVITSIPTTGSPSCNSN